jgi:hypothetical protein
MFVIVLLGIFAGMLYVAEIRRWIKKHWHDIKVTLMEYDVKGDQTNEPSSLKKHIGALIAKYPLLKRGRQVFAKLSNMALALTKLMQQSGEALVEVAENAHYAPKNTTKTWILPNVKLAVALFVRLKCWLLRKFVYNPPTCVCQIGRCLMDNKGVCNRHNRYILPNTSA